MDLSDPRWLPVRTHRKVRRSVGAPYVLRTTERPAPATPYAPAAAPRFSASVLSATLEYSVVFIVAEIKKFLRANTSGNKYATFVLRFDTVTQTVSVPAALVDQCFGSEKQFLDAFHSSFGVSFHSLFPLRSPVFPNVGLKRILGYFC